MVQKCVVNVELTIVHGMFVLVASKVYAILVIAEKLVLNVYKTELFSVPVALVFAETVGLGFVIHAGALVP